MTTDRSALISGIATGASATDSRGYVIMTKRFNLTGANQSETFSLPSDAQNLNLQGIITVAGSATTSNTYTIQKVGVNANVAQIASIGSATGNFVTYTTTSASLLLDPSGVAPTGTLLGSTDPISMTFVASSTDAATRGAIFLSYSRNNGQTGNSGTM